MHNQWWNDHFFGGGFFGGSFLGSGLFRGGLFKFGLFHESFIERPDFKQRNFEYGGLFKLVLFFGTKRPLCRGGCGFAESHSKDSLERYGGDFLKGSRSQSQP